MTIRCLLLFLLSCCFASVYAQPQINNWFFATGNGLSFSSGSPVAITGGRMGSMEGSSAISDQNGNLLFYSDGRTVWNKLHQVIVGGLAGGSGSSNQACVIIPKTADGKQYYIFTTDDEGGVNGLEYSVVDMTLNGGNGGMVSINTQLVSKTSEKVTAVRHCNKKDYWVITHKYGSDAYYAFLAGENGVSTTAVISHGGIFVPVTYATMNGAIKASPDGKKLIANHANLAVELSEFDNATGIVSNPREIFGNDNGIHYGAEFSANSSKVYITVTNYWEAADFRRYNGVFQFDLSSPITADIRNSKLNIFRTADPNQEMGSMQRGPDGKIYVVRYRIPRLSVINSPDIAGIGCNYVDGAINLSSTCEFSLPNFINDYTNSTNTDQFTITSTGTCINQAISFNYNWAPGITSIKWDFGDPASGLQNVSTLNSPSHIYTAAGPYEIKLIKFSPCGNDTLRKNIEIGNVQPNLGADKSFCSGSNVVLDPIATGTNNYLWQDGSTSPTLTATQAGLYWVQVSSQTNGCVRRDSVTLSVKPLPVITAGKDTVVCEGQSILLQIQSNGTGFTWQDGSLLSSLRVDRAGTYWVEASLDGCFFRDTVLVAPRSVPKFTLGADQYICPGLSLSLNPGVAGIYRWQDGSTVPFYTVTKSGTYYADISNSCGTSSDTIIIAPGNCTILVPSGFTPGTDGRNDIFNVLGTGLVNKFDMQIYNRNGQMVFATKDKSKGWDGRYRGADLPPAVYVYILRYMEINDPKEKIVKGTVVLIR